MDSKVSFRPGLVICKGLKAFSKCNITKVNFLLFPLPTPFYAKISEPKTTPETVVQRLDEFVTMQLKGGRRSRDNGDEGSKGNPVVLKTESKKKYNGKRCEFSMVHLRIYVSAG